MHGITREFAWNLAREEENESGKEEESQEPMLCLKFSKGKKKQNMYKIKGCHTIRIVLWAQRFQLLIAFLTSELNGQGNARK